MANTPGLSARVGEPALPRVGAARVCVALASDQPLIAEAVQAALRSREFDVFRPQWPDGPTVESQLAQAEPQVALLIYEVDSALRRAAAGAAIRAWPGPWLVLTGSAPGPIHGGLLEAGAAAVRRNGTSLDEVDALLRRLAAGKRVDPARRRVALIGQWRELERQHEFQARMDLLTPRERDVLALLTRGCSTREIAGILALSEATVRSHVHAVLTKLGVRSQLAAVAVVRDLDDLSSGATDTDSRDRGGAR